MSKIKEASQFINGFWSTPTPIGANDINIDITNATLNPSDSTSNPDGLIAADVTVGSGDTGATAWTKFNKFRKRVANVVSTLPQIADNTINTVNTWSSNKIDSQLNSEATTRENADTALQNTLNSEATTRANADTALQNTLNTKADQSDLAFLNLTETTNTTGSQIGEGTYFYLNGALVKAKVDIASGATFTDGTNYEAVTAGEELTRLNNHVASIAQHIFLDRETTKTVTLEAGIYLGIIARSNSNDSDKYGLYIIQAHSSKSNILAIKAASTTTLSISGLALTIESTDIYIGMDLFRAPALS